MPVLTDKLAELRLRIDAVNLKIVDTLNIEGRDSDEMRRLIKERRELSSQIGDYKAQHGLIAFDQAREDKMYASIRRYAASRGYDVEKTIGFMRSLVEESKKIQEGVLAHAG